MSGFDVRDDAARHLSRGDYERDTERISRGEKARNVSPQCWREEHGDCDCSALICRCECHRVEIDYFAKEAAINSPD